MITFQYIIHSPLVENLIFHSTNFDFTLFYEQEPAKKWENLLLSLEVAGSRPGIEGIEITPLARENIATP